MDPWITWALPITTITSLIPYVLENPVETLESVLGVSVPIFGTDDNTDYRDEILVDFV